MTLDFDFPVEIVRTDRRRTASIAIKGHLVRLTVPSGLSDSRIEKLLTNRTAWIHQKLNEQSNATPTKPKEYIDGESFAYLGRNYRLKLQIGIPKTAKLSKGRLLVNVPALERDGRFTRYIKSSIDDWYKAKALNHLRDKTARLSNQIGVSPKSVSIANFKARWGSCSPEGDVTYNWRIIAASHRIIDYVVVHELCHLIEHSHSGRYWQLVENIMPDYRERREWLRIHGQSLLI